MRFFLIIVLFSFTHFSFAKDYMPRECVESMDRESFSFLDQTKFIHLGECTAASLVKHKNISGLHDACIEVTENKESLMGEFSLSEAEAIKIGVCLGTINAIYTRYHNEYTNEGSSYYKRKKYNCKKGDYAINKLNKMGNEAVSRTQLRDALCHTY